MYRSLSIRSVVRVSAALILAANGTFGLGVGLGTKGLEKVPMGLEAISLAILLLLNILATSIACLSVAGSSGIAETCSTNFGSMFIQRIPFKTVASVIPVSMAINSNC